MLQLYHNIRHRRLELGMSQETLAEKVGYSDRTSIAKIEAGKVDLSQSKILAFAEALNTTASDLLGWEEETPTSIGSGRGEEFIRLFAQLSPVEQQMIVNQIKGILSAR